MTPPDKVLSRWFSHSEEQPVRECSIRDGLTTVGAVAPQPYRSQQGGDGEVGAKQNQGSPSFAKIQIYYVINNSVT